MYVCCPHSLIFRCQVRTDIILAMDGATLHLIASAHPFDIHVVGASQDLSLHIKLPKVGGSADGVDALSLRCLENLIYR